MPRARSNASHVFSNSLLHAVIAHLPAPARDGFPGADREAWITMARVAFDVVYGPVAAAPPLNGPAATVAMASAPYIAGSALRPDIYEIDADAYAMHGTRPIDPGDVPAGTVIIDRRTDTSDLNPIMWKTMGAKALPLPPGVSIRPANL